jgi:hypothetical protein
MQKEIASCGDKAEISLQANVAGTETVGIDGHYHVECRDADGNVKWTESFPNLVNAVGKQLMLNTLLRTSGTYTTVGPFLGLIGTTSPTFSATDTMTSHAGWTEFTNYTVGGSAVRGTAAFATATDNAAASPSNIVTSTATAITYTITSSGGNVTGCFLVTGSGASSTQSNTSGTLYSAGAFGSPKSTTAGDTVSVTYSTTATS